MQKGTISVSTENIFPVIKKWLYSDKDIFLRELVSNGCDAVTKHKKLVAMGNAAAEENYFVEVIVNKKEKTVTIKDNGIGMTEEEVINYIASVAFSGAEEFIKKYQDEDKEDSRIIGHFGLGFYSAFMVSELVDIKTLSYADGAKGVFWSCDGGTEYEIGESDKADRGTEIVLHINDDNKQFLEKSTLMSILNKYCGFFPVPIYLYEEGKEKGDKINDTEPLWLKKPSECKDEEYIAFYKKVFMDFNDPLFYIHLNVDYPFNLKGILFFPKLRHELEINEGQIKLFNNQVFVADNVKEIIPEFLLLLKGCIDCPDLPLNVSRSFLQNDGYAAKVSAHITKKVADKLISLFKKEPDNYKSYWDDISPFVKYGCMKDEKFYKKVANIVLYKTTDERYISLEDYLEDAKVHGYENTVYYTSDMMQQAQYISLFREQGIESLIMPTVIDNPFINFVESKNEGVKFKRIDSSIADALKSDVEKVANEDLIKLFSETIGDEKLKIEATNLKAQSVPAVLLISEESRRLRDMTRVYGSMGMSPDMFPEEATLSLNLSSELIKKLESAEDEELKKTICQQIYDIARIAQAPLDSKALAEFIKRSTKIMEMSLAE